MNGSIQTIPLINLALAFLPVILVIAIIWRWKAGHVTSIHAIARMLLQLLMIGYFLGYIFGSDSYWVVLAVLTVMVLTSSWIALRTVDHGKRKLYLRALGSIVLGGGTVLALVTQGVLALDPWYLPRFMIPLAGMIFASAMNSVSLAGDRLESELQKVQSYEHARTIAFRASLIPITNSLFAVGLVSLPGMMTGQILSGVSPLIAVRYQIMVMCMIFGATGIAAACFLTWTRDHFEEQRHTARQDEPD